MKRLLLLVAVLTLLPMPAQADWAIAITKGGNPVVAGNDQFGGDQGPYAVDACMRAYPHGTCRVIAKAEHGCAAMANNRASGAALHWSVAQGASQSIADSLALGNCKAAKVGACKVVNHFCR